jgi:hypothetical protein
MNMIFFTNLFQDIELFRYFAEQIIDPNSIIKIY